MASDSTPEKDSWQILDKARNLKDTFVNQSKEIGNIMKSSASAVEDKWKESSTATKAAIIGSATAAATPLVILPVLGVVGFTSGGVAAGSIAAAIQTAATVAGSPFALLQSAAATGIVTGLPSIIVSLGTGSVAGVLTTAIFKKKASSQNNGEEEQIEIEKEEPKYKAYLILSKI